MTKHVFFKKDTLPEFLRESSLEEFKNHLPLQSFPLVASYFSWLRDIPSSEGKEKLTTTFEFVDSPPILEKLAKEFTPFNFLAFLDFLISNPLFQNRLNFILAGLPSSIFFQALHIFHSQHLSLLKQEGLLEPLQYHLLQFVHEGEGLYNSTEDTLEHFQKDLKNPANQELTVDGLHDFLVRINGLKSPLLNYLECASTALSLVWNTDRIDLIDKVSTMNEKLQHQLTQGVGHSSFKNVKSTGLYALLEKTFSVIYDSALTDSDTALEGLTRFSIWHLKDYWELGLLPSIQDSGELTLNVEKDKEDEQRTHHQKLFSLIQQQLNELNIGTVGDLKKEYIFSKTLLKAYIDKQRDIRIELS